MCFAWNSPMCTTDVKFLLQCCTAIIYKGRRGFQLLLKTTTKTQPEVAKQLETTLLAGVDRLHRFQVTQLESTYDLWQQTCKTYIEYACWSSPGRMYGYEIWQKKRWGLDHQACWPQSTPRCQEDLCAGSRDSAERGNTVRWICTSCITIYISSGMWSLWTLHNKKTFS